MVALVIQMCSSIHTCGNTPHVFSSQQMAKKEYPALNAEKCDNATNRLRGPTGCSYHWEQMMAL
jgi:hypothetical protein